MKYIVIERARKSDFVKLINESHIHDEENEPFWKVWEKNQVEDDLKVSEYFDQMESVVENYAKNEPDYYWNWYTEVTKEEQ